MYFCDVYEVTLESSQDSKMVCVSGSVSPRKVGSSLSHSFFKSIFYLQYLYSLFILVVEIVAIFLCIYIYIYIRLFTGPFLDGFGIP